MIQKWDGIIVEFTKRKVRKNLNKFNRIGMEEDDAMQESWIVFNKCVLKNSHLNDVDFFNLYKRRLNKMFLKTFSLSNENPLNIAC